MIELNFIFTIGYRCYSPTFLKSYGLRQISGPFDYLFIDIESAFENNILYIVKNVKDYTFQLNNDNGTDNNLNYDNEYNIIMNTIL